MLKRIRVCLNACLTLGGNTRKGIGFHTTKPNRFMVPKCKGPASDVKRKCWKQVQKQSRERQWEAKEKWRKKWNSIFFTSKGVYSCILLQVLGREGGIIRGSALAVLVWVALGWQILLFSWKRWEEWQGLKKSRFWKKKEEYSKFQSRDLQALAWRLRFPKLPKALGYPSPIKINPDAQMLWKSQS